MNSPYKLIAADLNEDQSINIDDITLLNQANLGILNQFPNGRSWRFVDAAYSFPAPGNPWQEPWPETATFDSLSAGSSSKSFIAIKLGDVNGSAPGLEAEETAGFTVLEPRLLEYLRDNPGVPVLSAYPNPVVENLQVSYLVLEPGPVELELFSADGQRVKALLGRAWLDAGVYKGQYALGPLPAGLYVLRLESPDGVFLKKIVKC